MSIQNLSGKRVAKDAFTLCAVLASSLLQTYTTVSYTHLDVYKRQASSFSMERLPQRAAAIIPASSETGIKAPERPPTKLEAITPPFLTASLRCV